MEIRLFLALLNIPKPPGLRFPLLSIPLLFSPSSSASLCYFPSFISCCVFTDSLNSLPYPSLCFLFSSFLSYLLSFVLRLSLALTQDLLGLGGETFVLDSILSSTSCFNAISILLYGALQLSLHGGLFKKKLFVCELALIRRIFSSFLGGGGGYAPS